MADGDKQSFGSSCATFNRDSTRAKQPKSQDEHFEKTGGQRVEGKTAAKGSAGMAPHCQ